MGAAKGCRNEGPRTGRWRRAWLGAGVLAACCGCSTPFWEDAGFDPLRTPEMPQVRGTSAAADPAEGASKKAREIEHNLGYR